MYNSHNIATTIKATAKGKNIIIKQMLSDCNLGSNTMSAMYHGKIIASDSLARIADYLDCSVDYLLGRTTSPNGFIADAGLKRQHPFDDTHFAALSNSYKALNELGRTEAEKRVSELAQIPQYTEPDKQEGSMTG